MGLESMESENKLQVTCYVWFHNTFPELRGLLCYNLGNSKNAIDGARNKAMGLQKGRSDMVLYFNGTATMIEFKTDNGEQSQAQKDWELAVRIQGFSYYIVRSLQEFQSLIYKLFSQF